MRHAAQFEEAKLGEAPEAFDAVAMILAPGEFVLMTMDVPQPDRSLGLLAECGGQSLLGQDGYLRGAPEFVVEIAASSASLDVREKLDTYRRAGVREYLVWRTEDQCIDWWQLEDDEFRPLLARQTARREAISFPACGWMWKQCSTSTARK